jgi:GntR family transcriptional regulator, phosphonate transport system regulatory protein
MTLVTPSPRTPEVSADPSPDRPALLRGEGVSAWRQIVDGIEADIAAGRLAPGAQLATEAKLAERFGVNRHTVRRALAVLAGRGLVRATQGRGTFVEARPLAYPIGPRTRFSEIVTRAGREASGDLIAARRVTADAAVAEALGLAAGAPVLEIGTLHRADGTPISVARTALPLPRFEGLAELYAETGSLTRAYARLGIDDYVRVSTRITARLASADESALLELTPGRVVLVIDSVNADADGRPIQATRSRFAADRVQLDIEG